MAGTPVAGLLYAATTSGWVAKGRELVTAAADRTGLVAGAYIPGPGTTGLINPGATFTDVYPSSGDAAINISTPGTRTNTRYFGRVVIGQGVSGIKFDNCVFVGADPLAIEAGGSGLRGCIQNYGTNPPHFEVTNSVFNPQIWATEKGRSATSRGFASVVGIHGGNFTMRWTEIVNCQDGINYLGPNANIPGAADDAFCLMEMNWLHRGYYINNWYGPDDGQPHCDGFQTNSGKNITLRGNLIGGQRDVTGYLVWPGGYNAGDDFWNACLMFKQEVFSESAYIENVLVEKNWFGGGSASINQTADPEWTWASTVYRDNWILYRGSNWGQKMRGNGTGTPGVRVDTARAGGYYVLRPSLFAGQFINTRIWMPDGSDGGLAPISNG